MLSKAFMQKMAIKTRRLYVDHIFEKGKDVYDKPFKTYSSVYGKAKRANKIKRQSAAYSNRVTPVLTGELKNDAKPFATSNSFGVRFASQGGKIKGLAKMNPKRVLTHDNQPFPKKIISMILKDVNKEVSKHPTLKSRRIRIVLGK